MKKVNIWAALALSALVFTGCSDWTDPEAEQVTDYTNTQIAKPETYYKALRNYKKSDHSISFGWFSGWGEPGAATGGMLSGIPDSMDVVSLWGAWSNLSDAKKADLKYVQEVKGTKVVFCSFTSVVGQNMTPEWVTTPVEIDADGDGVVDASVYVVDGVEYSTENDARNAFWGWVDGDEAAIEASIRKYAHAILDTMNKYNYDGFDIDYEPNYGYGGSLASYDDRMHILIEELGKYIGPMSENPEKLFIIDGEPQSLHAKSGLYVSYFVIQAYSGTGGSTSGWSNSFSNLDSRLNTGLNAFSATLTELLGDKLGDKTIEEYLTNRYVMTENLEPATDCLLGGYRFYDRNGHQTSYPSLIGFAAWEPLNGYRKGGFGAYQFGYEAPNTPSYKWMRTAIQVCNPAVN